MTDDEAIVRKLRKDWGPLAADFVEQCQPDPEVQEATLRRILSIPEVQQCQPVPQARTATLRRVLRTVKAELPARTWVLHRLWTPKRAAAVLAAVVVAVAGIVGAMQLSSPRQAYAATPAPLTYLQPAEPVPAGTVLNQIAAAAATAPAAGPAGATVEHLQLQSWDVYAAVDGARVVSAVVPTQTQSWRTAGNAGVVIKQYLQPTFPDERARRAWQDDGSPGSDTAPRREDYRNGTFPALWTGRPPSDPKQLRVWLQYQHQNATEPAMIMLAIVDLLKERVLTPPERAGLLRLLAQLPSLEYTGSVTDRAGRPGDAFSINSDATGLPTRHTLIVDSTTGAFLAYEQTLTSTPGRLNVKIPAVVSYTVFVTTERVTAVPGPR